MYPSPNGLPGYLKSALGKKRGHRQSGIVCLVFPGKRRTGKGHAFSKAGKLKAVNTPVTALHQQRRPNLPRLIFNCRQGPSLLRRNHQRHTRLGDPGLFPGDRFQIIPEEHRVVEADRRDNRHQRLINNIGGVQTAAQANLEKADVSRVLGKRQQGGCGGHLEKGYRLPFVGRLHPFQDFNQVIFFNQGSGQPDAFAERNQMGRGIDMNPETRSLQDGSQGRHHRSLAVGPGDVNDRRKFPLRISQMFQQPLKTA